MEEKERGGERIIEIKEEKKKKTDNLRFDD